MSSDDLKSRWGKWMRKPRVFLLVALISTNLAAFAIGSRWIHSERANLIGLETSANADAQPSGETGLLKKSSESFRAVVKKVGPAVVTIKATQGLAAPVRRRGPGPRGHQFAPPPPDGDEDSGPPGGGDPFSELFRHFGRPYPYQQQPESPSQSLGSGIIIDKRGYILTNNHVVQGASKVVVNLPGQESVDINAKIVGTDPRSDLAVLKIRESSDLPAAEWADSDAVEVGDWAIAIGSPFMLSHTVTLGIVSAKERNSSMLMGSQYGYDMLQTDAAINPGNSGGPLCTVDGKVMGVNTAIFTRSGGYMGIGFAIPSNVARKIADTLIGGKKVVRGFLGVTIQPVDENTAKDLGIKAGGLIHSVEPTSPAAKAGLKPGDIIVEIAGKPVKDISQIQRTVSGISPGTKIPVRVINYGDRKSRAVEVTIGSLPDATQSGENDEESASAPDPLGLSVAKSSGGVTIQSVEPGSPADAVGLQKGDKIVSINRVPMQKVEAYAKAVKSSKNLNVLVSRGGQEIFVQITLP